MALTYSIPSAWLVGEEHQQGRKKTLGVPNFILTPKGYSIYGISPRLPLIGDYTSPIMFNQTFDPYDYVGY